MATKAQIYVYVSFTLPYNDEAGLLPIRAVEEKKKRVKLGGRIRVH